METNVVLIKSQWCDTELKENTWIVIGNESCVVIDAGSPIEKVKKLTNLKIVGVFITHGHCDHISYIEEYDKSNIPIYINKKTYDFLLDSDKNATKLFNKDIVYHCNNLKFVDDGDVVKFDDYIIKCFTTPGHTEDGMSYLFDEKYLFSGDTLFSICVGRYDLLTGDKKVLLDSIKKLDTINYQQLCPGHGRASSKQEQISNVKHWISVLSEE